MACDLHSYTGYLGFDDRMHQRRAAVLVRSVHIRTGLDQFPNLSVIGSE